MAEHGGPETMTDYIKHHLHHLETPVGDGGFWVLHLDSIFFKLALAACSSGCSSVWHAVPLPACPASCSASSR